MNHSYYTESNQRTVHNLIKSLKGENLLYHSVIDPLQNSSHIDQRRLNFLTYIFLFFLLLLLFLHCIYVTFIKRGKQAIKLRK